MACTTDGWSWTDGKHAYGSPSRTRVGAFRHRMGLCGHPMPAGEGIEKQFRSLLQGLIDTRGKVSRSQKTVTRFGWPFLNALVEVWRAWEHTHSAPTGMEDFTVSELVDDNPWGRDPGFEVGVWVNE